MLLVIIGLPGVGKSYVGKLLEKEFGFYHYEADQDLTLAIKEAIQKQQPIPESIREEYFNIVCDQIQKLKAIHKNVVVTQTFTKHQDRQKILEHFPDAYFIWIKAEQEILDSRLATRTNHLVNKSYALLSRKLFDKISGIDNTSNGLCHFFLNNNYCSIEGLRPELRKILSGLKLHLNARRQLKLIHSERKE